MKVSIVVGILGALILCSHRATAKPMNENNNVSRPNWSSYGALGGYDSGFDYEMPGSDESSMNSESTIGSIDSEISFEEGENQLAMAYPGCGSLSDLYLHLLDANPHDAVNLIRNVYDHRYGDRLGNTYRDLDGQYFERLNNDIAGKISSVAKDYITAYLSILRFALVLRKNGLDLREDASNFSDIIKFLDQLIKVNTSSYNYDDITDDQVSTIDQIAQNAWKELNSQSLV